MKEGLEFCSCCERVPATLALKQRQWVFQHRRHVHGVRHTETLVEALLREKLKEDAQSDELSSENADDIFEVEATQSGVASAK